MMEMLAIDFADIVTPAEMADARAWTERAFAGIREGSSLPFDFTYGGKTAGELLPGWSPRETREGSVRRFTWTDPGTGLRVTIEFTTYPDFPAVEWTLRFTNTGAADTPMLEEIRSLDLRLPVSVGSVLHHFTGDYCDIDGYAPHALTPAPGVRARFAPDGGRPTNRAWPYFNVEDAAAGAGTFVVVGWSGQWAAEFACDDALHVTAGQELTHLTLHPGESIRTPISLLVFWRGDETHATNLWRRFMLAHNLPRPGGRLPAPFMPGNTSLWFNEMTQATDKDQMLFIDRYAQEKIGIDYWWMDAGWYPCEGNWPKTGTWEPDYQRFPRGLRAISDHAKGYGIDTLVWFEPERVAPDTWLYTERPQWLLGTSRADVAGDAAQQWFATVGVSENKLLNLGNPEALAWLIEHVSNTIAEQGIDLYRQDFNFEPLPYWRANDPPDRQGITENHYVEGYLAYWKALRARFPDMLIDSCASGGRRNDLETMRLGVPIHKTDYNYSDLPTKQAFHQTLFRWLPFFGAPVLPVEEIDAYAFRSAYCLCTVIGFDMRRDDLDYDLLRALTAEWRRIAPFFYGDYYPLTPFSRADDAWLAWQFHRPDLHAGLVQAFRRADCSVAITEFTLRGLDPDAVYTVTDLDAPEQPVEMTGTELMEAGLPVGMESALQAKVIVYQTEGDR